MTMTKQGLMLVWILVACGAGIATSDSQSTGEMAEEVLRQVWVGEWHAPTTGTSVFEIVIWDEEGTLRGRHCFASLLHLDCPSPDEQSLFEFTPVSETVLDLRFMTAFGPGTPEERTGRARLELFAPDSVVWTEVEPPVALAQVPVSATLLRQPEP